MSMLQFTGTQVADDIILRNKNGTGEIQSADGGRLLFNGIGQVEINPLDGIDKVTVRDLSGTGILDVSINLAGTLGGAAPDGQVDQIVIEGTQAADTVNLGFSGNSANITGLATSVALTNADGADQLTVRGLGGDDTLAANNSFPTGFALTLDGGNGNDTLLGSVQADTLLGGNGNDAVTGGRGSDTVLLGSGHDAFIWNPGDGSDSVDGQDGADALQFNSANVGEAIAISANGGRAALTRNVANITMDLNGVESINLAVLGGADAVAVNDLAGTAVKRVNVDLAGSGGIPDGAVDTVAVVGTGADEQIKLATSGVQTVAGGLAAKTYVSNAEAADVVNVQAGLGNDRFDLSGLTGAGPTLALDGGDGADAVLLKGTGAGDSIALFGVGGGVLQLVRSGINADALTLANIESLLIQGQNGDDTLAAGNGFPAGLVLTLDGGNGKDTLIGSDQADTLQGGNGNDSVTGGRGSDTALLGSGQDVFAWNPGDGSDVVEGQDGADALQFNGSNVGEAIAISANGGRATLTRNIANITMDLDGVETINLTTLGGVDAATVNDLTGTAVKRVNVDLAGSGGIPDGAADVVSVNGTDQNDVIKLANDGTAVAVSRLHAKVGIAHGETIDTINVQAGAGDDRIDASGVTAAGPALVLDGGAGNDVLIGGAGATIFVNGERVVGFDVSQDQLDLRAIASGQSVDWVLAHAHDEPGNAVFDFDSTQITLVGVSVGQLQADDFIIS